LATWRKWTGKAVPPGTRAEAGRARADLRLLPRNLTLGETHDLDCDYAAKEDEWADGDEDDEEAEEDW